MGLFGLFYTLFGIGCKGVSNINDAVKDNENRTIYRDNETNTYYDHNMNRRDLSTNHLMHTEKDVNGEIGRAHV